MPLGAGLYASSSTASLKLHTPGFPWPLSSARHIQRTCLDSLFPCFREIEDTHEICMYILRFTVFYVLHKKQDDDDDESSVSRCQRYSIEVSERRRTSPSCSERQLEDILWIVVVSHLMTPSCHNILHGDKGQREA